MYDIIPNLRKILDLTFDNLMLIKVNGVEWM
jgi:hypothetical protein